jgi:hypothetical protein
MLQISMPAEAKINFPGTEHKAKIRIDQEEDISLGRREVLIHCFMLTYLAQAYPARSVNGVHEQ